MPNFLSRLRKKKHWCAFLTIASTWEVQNRLSVIVTPRNLVLFTLSSFLSEVNDQFFSFGNVERLFSKDVVKLERVQKRFTRMLPELEDLSSRESLNRLGLFALECQRLREDLIEVYKIMRGMDR
eukprot:g29945.t1